MKKDTAKPAPAVTFTTKDGKTVTYDKPFKCDDKHLGKFMLIRNGEGEGPWMWIHPDDLADYKADVSDSRVRLGVAANDCLAGLPWGCVFPYIMCGGNRPKCNMDTLMDLKNGKPQPYLPLFEVGAKAALKRKKISAGDLRMYVAVLGADHALVVKLNKLPKPKETK